MKTLSVLLASALVTFAAPVSAQLLPRPEQVARPSERALLPKFRDALNPAGGKAAAALAALDGILADLPEPTPFRGLVQFFRGNALASENRTREADDALAESIRLLPDHSAPLILAAEVHSFSDRAASAADYLLRASRIDPGSVNRLDDYQLDGLLRRLEEANDHARLKALSERLLSVGWRNGSPRTVSTMAIHAVEARVERGDMAGAAALVPKIVSPSAFMPLLTEDKFKPLRPSVEAWAGSRLEKQWPIHLAQARSEWEAMNDPEAGRRYLTALVSAGHHRTAAATFLPLFDRIDPQRDEELIFMASPLARSLASLGRWQEAFSVFEKALRAWPRSSHANALNLTANRARLHFFKGDFETALSGFDAALKDAQKWGPEVNQGAIASMHLYRSCTLAQLGRSAQDVTSYNIVMSRKAIDPSAFAYLQLCRDDLGFAREGLIQALEVEDTRAEVIALMQPDDDHSYDSDFARTLKDRWRQLRSDEKLVADVSRYGRVLPEPANASAPAEKLADRPS